MKKKKRYLVKAVSGAMVLSLSSAVLPNVFLGNDVSTVLAENIENDQSGFWEINFAGEELGNWKDIVGKINKKVTEKGLEIVRDVGSGNNAVSLNLDSPNQADGEAEVSFSMTGGKSRIGLVVRGTEAGNWVFLGYNNGTWMVEKPGAWKDDIKGPVLEENKSYVFKARYEGTKVTMYLNGEEFYSGEPILSDGSKIPVNEGHIGFRTWYDTKTVSFSYFKNGTVGSIPELEPEIISIEPIELFINKGEAPKLPETVTVHYNTGKTASENVEWEEIPEEKFQQPGKFEVTGKVSGTVIPAKAIITVVETGELEEGEKISTEKLAVILDPEFPRVLRYENPSDDTLIFKGQVQKNNQVAIDGKNYNSNASLESIDGDKATYLVKVDELSLSFKVNFKIGKDKQLSMTLTDIKEGKELIHTISLANQGLLSVSSLDEGAAFAGAAMYTAVNANNNNKNGDTFEDLTTSNKVGTFKYMYAFLNNSKYAASIWTNSNGDKDSSGKKIDHSDSHRIHRRSEKTDQGFVTELSSGAWTYRPFDGDKQAIVDEVPEVRINFSGDLNEDKQVDWQDAAINFREIMNNPKGSELVPELVNQRIPMNFASQATNPFLTSLDETKRVYNLTDGLGQMVLLKGYQNEGHDSAHPDYDAVGLRPGGVEDLNKLIEEGHKLNGVFGVHINDSESYPEAKSFNEDLVDINARGWDWLDPSYMIKQRPDALTGNRFNRFKELKKKVPGMDFIYVDVWGNRGEAGWESRQIAREINDLDMIVTNEFPNSLEYDSVWNHWSAQSDYGGKTVKGFNSNIVRFIRNHQKDTWIISDNVLLGGTEFIAHEGWYTTGVDFNLYEQVTFSTNIPTKFLQHYEITNWKTETAANGKIHGTIQLKKGDDRVVVTDENESKERVITLNDKIVLQGDSYLLPWNVDGQKKLYHWNVKGGTTSWEVDTDLGELDNLRLYQLTDQGRVDKGAVVIEDGKIVIEAAEKTPYVIASPDSIESVEFGSHTALKDPGFNAKDTLKKNWKVERGSPEIKRDINGDYVMEAGPQEMKVTQKLRNLKAGKYSAYINTEAHNRPVKLAVDVGGKTYTHEYKDALVQNYIQADVNHTKTKYPQYMQKARIDFEISEKDVDKVSLSIEAAAGEGTVRFDDIQVTERQENVQNLDDHILVSQNFEDTRAVGLYPFVKGSAGGVEDPRVHLSEKHEPYTQYGWNGNKVSDVLEGNWSLKAHKQRGGMMLQTTPQTLTFEPGVRYQISFDYQTSASNQFYYGVFDEEFKSIDHVNWGSKSLSSTAGDGKTRHIDWEIVGSENGNTMFGFYTNGGAHDLIIDNFTVKKVIPSVESIKLNTSDLTILKKGKTLDLKPEIFPKEAASGKLSWKIAKETVASVDEKGILKALKPGTTKVTAVAENGVETSFTLRVTR